MFERFTDDARSVVMHAKAIAERNDDDHIDAQHLAMALMDDLETGPIFASRSKQDPNALDDGQLLASLGIHLDDVRRHADSLFGSGALDSASGPSTAEHAQSRRRPFDTSAKNALEASLRHALRLECRSIGPSHLALAVLDDELAWSSCLEGSDSAELRQQLESVAVDKYGRRVERRWWRRAG